MLLGALLLLAATGLIEGLGIWYFTGLVAAAALAMRQQALIRNRLPDDCFRAFLDNNIFGMVIFLGLVLHFAFAGV